MVQLPLTTLGQETRWAYSTPPPSPHGAGCCRLWLWITLIWVWVFTNECSCASRVCSLIQTTQHLLCLKITVWRKFHATLLSKKISKCTTRQTVGKTVAPNKPHAHNHHSRAREPTKWQQLEGWVGSVKEQPVLTDNRRRNSLNEWDSTQLGYCLL